MVSEGVLCSIKRMKVQESTARLTFERWRNSSTQHRRGTNLSTCTDWSLFLSIKNPTGRSPLLQDSLRIAQQYEHVHEKTNNLEFQPLRHRPGCTITEAG